MSPATLAEPPAAVVGVLFSPVKGADCALSEDTLLSSEKMEVTSSIFLLLPALPLPPPTEVATPVPVPVPPLPLSKLLPISEMDPLLIGPAKHTDCTRFTVHSKAGNFYYFPAPTFYCVEGGKSPSVLGFFELRHIYTLFFTSFLFSVAQLVVRPRRRQEVTGSNQGWILKFLWRKVSRCLAGVLLIIKRIHKFDSLLGYVFYFW